MVRRFLVVAICALSACGRSDERPQVNVANAHQTVAWIGQQDGLTIIAESLAVADDPANASTSEEQLIREELPDAERVDYLRVHLFGSANEVARELQIANASQEFVEFAAPPAALSSVQSLLWEAVLRGRPLVSPADGAVVHRSLVLGSESELLDSSAAQLQWRSGDDYGDLTRRSWGQVDRREYFEGLLQPAVAESEESP